MKRTALFIIRVALASITSILSITSIAPAQPTITVDEKQYRSSKTLFRETFEACETGAFPESLLLPGLSDASKTDPIARAFGRFHYEQSLESLTYCAETIRRNAKELKGRDDFTVSGNFGSLMETPGPDWIRWATIFDYVNLEWRFNEANAADPASLTFLSILNAIGRPVTLVGKAENNRKWRIHGDNPIYHDMMVAEAYATGHSVTVPFALFDGTRGESRYFGNIARMAPVYHFISERKHLFDGHEPVATYAIIVAGARYGGIYNSPISQRVDKAASALTPFKVVLSAEYLPTLDAAQFDGIETAELVGEIDEFRAEDRAIIGDVLKRKSSDGPVFKVSGSDKIRVLPRASISDKQAPLVVHLLNKNATYDGNITTVKPASFTLRFHRRLISDDKIDKILLHRATGKRATIPFTTTGDYYTVEIPQLSIWGILEIHAADTPTALPPPRRRPFPQSEIILMRPGHRYEKPDHIVKALTVDGELDETRIIDLYRITRISWEYRMFPGFREKGVAYVGTTNASHLDLADRGVDWDGWARKADGSIIPDKSSGNKTLALLGHASDAFREYLVTQATQEWIVRYGADGIQWDGTPSMAIKSWGRGGDYSKGSVDKFRKWLAKKFTSDELTKMGVEDVASFDVKSYMAGLSGDSQFFFCDEYQGQHCLALKQKDIRDKKTKNLVGTPTLRSRTGLTLFSVDLLIAKKGSGAAKVAIHLKDGEGEGLYGTYIVEDGVLKIFSHGGDYSLPFELGKWTPIHILCDFDREMAAVSLDGKTFTPFYKLRRPGLVKEGFGFYLFKRADSRNVYVRKIGVVDVKP